MEPQQNCESLQPLQGSFERELQKMFFALRGADRTGKWRDYYSGVILFLSTLCYNTYSEDEDRWLSVTPSTSSDTQFDLGADFTVDFAHSSTKTVGRDFTTTPILSINCLDSDFGEKGESHIYDLLRSRVLTRFNEMEGGGGGGGGQQPGAPEVLSTLSFIGGTWRWDDWSCTDTQPSRSRAIRMERGRGESVVWARSIFTSRREDFKAWEVPTPMGLEIDPNFVELWAELLENYGLEPRLFTQESGRQHHLEVGIGTVDEGPTEQKVGKEEEEEDHHHHHHHLPQYTGGIIRWFKNLFSSCL